jgi:hypothetical protein
VSESVAIILHIRAEEADTFEQMFEQHVVPLWDEYKAAGKFIHATLTPATDGSQMDPAVRDYILYVETPSRAGHTEWDADPRFLEFLPGAQALQPEEPLVWLGETRFSV